MTAASTPTTRDWTGTLSHYLPDAPKKDVVESKFGKFLNVVEEKFPVKEPKLFYKRYPVKIVDARTHLSGGKDAWKFEEHGFCFITPPAYEFEEHKQQNRRRVDSEYGPKVAEICRVACGAKRAFWMSHQRRAENGTPTEGYARGAGHSDYGFEFEKQFRTVLTARYGVPEAEAQSCGLCVANMWAPVERPAFKNPLALLDASTIDMQKETTRYILHQSVDNGYGYYNGFDTKKSLQRGDVEEMKEEAAKAQRKLEARVPQAAMDAPAMSPLWAEHHRWVYLSDMQLDEAVVFKQVDFRPSSTAKATFHVSFPDPFHKDWKDCPGRRSIECRVILMYDPETPVAKL